MGKYLLILPTRPNQDSTPVLVEPASSSFTKSISISPTNTPIPQQCFDHDEHFTTNHAQLSEGSDPNNQWGYCPSKTGCCADGKTWYACKNVSFRVSFTIMC